MMFDGQTGEPRALLNGAAVTEIRTAAVSVLATDVLARPGAADLAVVGTGVQARAHILAFSQTRPLDRIRVAGRSQARAIDLAADLRPQVRRRHHRLRLGGRGGGRGRHHRHRPPARPSPCWERGWISDGAHINAVGAYHPAARELDGATVAAAALFADRRESLEAESGDFLLAVAEGAGRARPPARRAGPGADRGGAGPDRLRTRSPLFESLGLGVEDLAVAGHVCRQAVAAGAGQWVTF